MAVLFEPGRVGTVQATAALTALTFAAGACGHASTDSSSTPSTPTPVPVATAPSVPPASTAQAAAPQLHFVQHTAARSVAATIAALRERAATEGMTVTGELHPPGMQVLLLDNPQAGKLFFRANPAVGAELPVALYVWADQQAKAHVGYFDPEDMVEAIDANMADGCRALASTIDLIAQDAIGDPGTDGDPAPAQFVVTASPWPFGDTVRTLKDRIGHTGLQLLGEVDQATMMRTAGLDLPGADIMFIAGTPPTSAAAPPDDGPPTRVYVWVGHDKATHICYLDPAADSAISRAAAGAGQRLTPLLAEITRSKP